MTSKCKEAMRHLGDVLSFFAELHPDDRCKAFDDAMSFYNKNNPDAQIVTLGGFESYLVLYSPLDRAIGRVKPHEQNAEIERLRSALETIATADQPRWNALRLQMIACEALETHERAPQPVQEPPFGSPCEFGPDTPNANALTAKDAEIERLRWWLEKIAEKESPGSNRKVKAMCSMAVAALCGHGPGFQEPATAPEPRQDRRSEVPGHGEPPDTPTGDTR